MSHVVVPGEELSLSFTTAQGPGGQNVNRVQTRAELRWDLSGTAVLSERVLERLRKAAGRRLTAEGVLVLTSQRYRKQARNIADVRERLADMIRVALPEPSTRKKTRPTRASKRRRVTEKRRRSEVKQRRKKPRGE